MNALLKTGLVRTSLAACAVIALVSLGGCGGQPAAAAAPGAAGAPIPLPKLKPGKWKVLSTKDGKRGEPDESCVTEPSVEKLVQPATLVGKSCTRTEVKMEDGVVVGRFYCKQGKGHVTTTLRATGDFEKSYQIEARQQFSPPLKGKSQSITNVAAERTADCVK